MTDTAKRPILVVDDDPSLRETVTDHLGECGFPVVAAPSGEAALHLLANGVDPSLVITDVVMPVMSGWDLAERIVADGRNVPVVLMSARWTVLDSRWPGVVATLRKPFDLGELERVCLQYGQALGGEDS